MTDNDTKVKVAVVQAATEGADAEKTLAKAERLIAECGEKGVKVAVFPEAFIGGYPKGADFSICIGMRREQTREEYLAYASRAIVVPSPETDRLGAAARDAGLYLTMGIIEKEGGTLYCCILYFGPDGALLGKHRKLLPTAAEKLIWGQGDGSTLSTVDTPWGPMGAVVCWENYMPLLRMAMYDQGVTLYCTPTADARDTWVPSMRHVALEGRCFVLSACQYLKREQFPNDIANSLNNDVLMRGGSAIISPLGEILAGPDFDGETILACEIDVDDVMRAKFDHDINGHYSRPEIFHLQVDTSERRSVTQCGKLAETTP